MDMATPEPPSGPPPTGARPPEMGSTEVTAFLTHLAVEGQVSASTQNQALSALLFLYRVLLERDLNLEGVVRARKPRG